MRRIAIFGKGGIGKSTVAAALATLLHRAGERVLHVGCDPKHDASLLHGPSGIVPTVMGEFVRLDGQMSPLDVERTIVEDTRTGVHVLEAGGPEPGQGCGGRAVSLTLTLLDTVPRIAAGSYDTLILDVLGDVVCGGFVAPLRSREPADVVIVTSPEFLALYAANNIARGLSNLSTTGRSRLVGVIANKVDDDSGRTLISAFAAGLGSRLLAAIPTSDALRAAALDGRALDSNDLDSAFGFACGEVLKLLRSCRETDRIVPTPFADDGLRSLARAPVAAGRS